MLVVAAVGNGDNAPRSPWPFASYPAALPHVLGVSALGRDGAVPAFSNRDRIYNDLVGARRGPRLDAPARADRGAEGVHASRATRAAGRSVYRKGDGTSFAAAQVSAAAAVLLAVRPTLHAGAGDRAPDAHGARRQRRVRLPRAARSGATG